jgi:hypothetical protein
MATPTYSGAGQPVAQQTTGLLGGLSTFFGFGGSSTPAYAGAGQPTSVRGGLLGGVTPAYATATSPTDLATAPKSPPATLPVDYVQCPIDPQALAAGQIAIVIPINGPLPESAM